MAQTLEGNYWLLHTDTHAGTHTLTHTSTGNVASFFTLSLGSFSRITSWVSVCACLCVCASVSWARWGRQPIKNQEERGAPADWLTLPESQPTPVEPSVKFTPTGVDIPGHFPPGTRVRGVAGVVYQTLCDQVPENNYFRESIT